MINIALSKNCGVYFFICYIMNKNQAWDVKPQISEPAEVYDKHSRLRDAMCFNSDCCSSYDNTDRDTRV